MSARKTSRSEQVRGPNPPVGKGAGQERRGHLFGGYDLDHADEHLRRFHALAQDTGEDDDYFRFTRAVVVAARRWRKIANDRVKPLGHTMVRWETLYVIATADEDLNQSELARLVGVEGPTMVRILHMLAEEGMIERHQSRQDLRVTINRITPRGMAVVTEIMGVTNHLRGEVMADIDPGELEKALEVLNKVLLALERLQRGDGQETG